MPVLFAPPGERSRDNRTTWTLQLACGLVGAHADDKARSELAGALKEDKVSEVEEIEHAVGEDDHARVLSFTKAKLAIDSPPSSVSKWFVSRPAKSRSFMY
jgi:hypothetical protein